MAPQSRRCEDVRNSRRSGISITTAGVMLLVSIVKQFVLPGLLEFVLITAAHLLLAVGTFLLTLRVLEPRSLALALGGVWGAGWLGFHVNELLMLLFVLPPPWLLLVATAAILIGGMAVVIARIAVPARTNHPARPGTLGLLVLVLASSAPLWADLVVMLLPDAPFLVGYWFRALADLAAAVVTLIVGVRILRPRR